MAPLVSKAAGVAAAVIAAATDLSGSDYEVATDLHAEQLTAEQLRGQHPVPITAADHRNMEIQIQEALAEDLLMDTVRGNPSNALMPCHHVCAILTLLLSYPISLRRWMAKRLIWSTAM
eukprot:TRINITY_DN6839_c0_g1_i2.p1 TRINITY_DN6839_c0_g1~~TRINITY_DN6839_c0_g1_i2.p1  ORF type:complete len:131 (-),score=20.01 TRINITY_DN6839_c0_g1_i2:142-498(-)